MVCKHCGKEVKDNSTFCEHCGRVLDDYISFNTTYTQKDNPSEKEENDHKQLGIYFGINKHFIDFYSRGKGIIGLAVLLIIIASIVFLFYKAMTDEAVDFLGKIYLYVALGIVALASLTIFFFFIKSILSTYLGWITKYIGKDSNAIIKNTFVSGNEQNPSYYITYVYRIFRIKHQTTQRVSVRTFDSSYQGKEINIKKSLIIGVYLEDKNY